MVEISYYSPVDPSLFGLLSLVLIGIPFLAVLLVLNVVFPVIAALKAGEDRVWRYPLSITFFK